MDDEPRPNKNQRDQDLSQFFLNNVKKKIHNKTKNNIFRSQ